MLDCHPAFLTVGRATSGNAERELAVNIAVPRRMTSTPSAYLSPTATTQCMFSIQFRDLFLEHVHFQSIFPFC